MQVVWVQNHLHFKLLMELDYLGVFVTIMKHALLKMGPLVAICLPDIYRGLYGGLAPAVCTECEYLLQLCKYCTASHRAVLRTGVLQYKYLGNPVNDSSILLGVLP